MAVGLHQVSQTLQPDARAEVRSSTDVLVSWQVATWLTGGHDSSILDVHARSCMVPPSYLTAHFVDCGPDAQASAHQKTCLVKIDAEVIAEALPACQAGSAMLVQLATNGHITAA